MICASKLFFFTPQKCFVKWTVMEPVFMVWLLTPKIPQTTPNSAKYKNEADLFGASRPPFCSKFTRASGSVRLVVWCYAGSIWKTWHDLTRSVLPTQYFTFCSQNIFIGKYVVRELQPFRSSIMASNYYKKNSRIVRFLLQHSVYRDQATYVVVCARVFFWWKRIIGVKFLDISKPILFIEV